MLLELRDAVQQRCQSRLYKWVRFASVADAAGGQIPSPWRDIATALACATMAALSPRDLTARRGAHAEPHPQQLALGGRGLIKALHHL
jgi:hypothetical protein